MLKTRVISACVFVPVILAAVFFGGWVFAALMLAIAVLGGYEYGKIIEINEYTFLPRIYYPAAVVLLLAAELCPKSPGVTLAALFLAFVGCMVVFIMGKKDLDDVAVNIAAVVYIPMTLAMAILIRSGLGDGMFLVYLLLIIEWLTDSGAYFIGSAIGKHKLSPKVSPNKSIEGAVGGVVVAVVASLLFNIIVGILPYPYLILVAVVVSVVGQLGDLCESALKRWAGVKDSGNIIPGHGGILDRFDSFFFAAPFLYLLLAVYHVIFV